MEVQSEGVAEQEVRCGARCTVVSKTHLKELLVRILLVHDLQKMDIDQPHKKCGCANGR